MTREELFALCEEVDKKTTDIMRKKNQDYSRGDDPFKNFRSSIVVGMDAERAILVRKLDKITRVGNLIDKDPLVTEESFEDTLLDDINYSKLLIALHRERMGR